MLSIRSGFSASFCLFLVMCGKSDLPEVSTYEEHIPRATVVANEQVPLVDEVPRALIVPPTPLDLALPLLRTAPYDVDAIRENYRNGIFDRKVIRKEIPDGFFPSEAAVVDSHLLPFKSARVDIFMSGARIHGIAQEFSILSIDGQIRAIGRVSTGKTSSSKTTTPSRRWEIYGVDKNRKSTTFGNAPMPYAIMLSNFGDKFYSEVAFHGSPKRYAFNYPDSHGCIRQFTESFVLDGTRDPQARWPQWGYHRIVWSLLVPPGITHGDHLENFWYGSWYDETEATRAIIRELRYKTTVWTHRAASLQAMPAWKDTFEKLYPKSVILAALDRSKKGARGYAQFADDASATALNLDTLRKLYKMERTRYHVPSYLKNDDSDDEHYERRYTDWLK